MTNKTEVLRISGNVRLETEDVQIFKLSFYELIEKFEGNFAGSIVPQDDPSGMRLYRVEDVEAYQRLNHNYEEQIINLNKTKSENDKLTLSLSEELAQEKISRKNQYVMLSDEITRLYYDKQSLLKIISSLELRLRSKESRWRTFIKWWKELWTREEEPKSAN